MSSLWKTAGKSKKRIQLKANPFPILRRAIKYLARGNQSKYYIKRTPLSHLLAGSMTVEASIVIPLCIFFFMNLMSAGEMLRLHGNVALALWEKGRIMAVGAHVYDAVYGEGEGQMGDTGDDEAWKSLLSRLGGTLLTDAVLASVVISDLGTEYLDESPLTYGKEGLNFLESAYMKDDYIDIKVTYQVSPVFSIPGFSSFRMANRYYARAWTGYQVNGTTSKQETAEYVYVAQYGEVYHMNRSCSYLVRNVRTFDISEVESIRNNSGERYHPCTVCGEKGKNIVYVTQEGNKYHGRRDCPSLIRTVTSVKYETAAEKYRPCSRCAS